MSNEGQIRSLIERWASAVHTGDLENVLADHATQAIALRFDHLIASGVLQVWMEESR